MRARRIEHVRAEPADPIKRSDDSAMASHPSPVDLAKSLTDAALREASSDAIFQRGRAYASSGAVEVTSEDAEPSPALHAQVRGTEDYSTSVWVDEDEVTGACDCPHAQEGWFCKHQVAVALVWRDRLSGQTTEIDEDATPALAAVRKAVQTHQKRRESLKAFLHGRPAAELVDRLLEMADQSREISRELQQWRKLGEAAERPAEWKSMVTEILAPGADFLAWNETGAYVRRASAVLPLLDRARETQPEKAVALCQHAMRRAWVAIGDADDSDGEIGGLCQAIGARWLAALQAAGPQASAFGDSYLALRLEDPIDSFDDDAVEQAMGPAALDRFRHTLAKRWREASEELARVRAVNRAEMSAKKATVRDSISGRASVEESERKVWPLERLYLEQLEKVGDVDAALAVLRADLSTPSNYHQVTRFLERHGRHREAFVNAEQAYREFPDDWRLQDDLLERYERDGWSDEALALRRRRFDEEPSVETFRAVLKAGTAAGADADALRDELMRWLEERERVALEAGSSRSRYAAKAGARRPVGRDVSLRAEILCAEGHWDEGVLLVQRPAVCSGRILERIALHLGPERAHDSVSLLRRVFDAAMPRATNPYADELSLVREIAARLDDEPRAVWLSELRTTYRAKRNFIRDLPRP